MILHNIVWRITKSKTVICKTALYEWYSQCLRPILSAFTHILFENMRNNWIKDIICDAVTQIYIHLKPLCEQVCAQTEMLICE